MVLSQQERTLRQLTVCAWIPAIALVIPLGVHTHSICPALALIPMTMSAVFGLAKLFDYIRTDYHLSTVTIHAVTIDGLILMMLLGFTLPGVHNFFQIPELGTFASFPLLMNICIHSFFLLHDTGLLPNLQEVLRPQVCQYCHRDLHSMWDMKVEHSQKAGNIASPPTRQVTENPGPAPALAPEPASASKSAPLPPPAERPSSTSPSNFTTPRPSTDYAETLTSGAASIRTLPPSYKGRHSCDAV